ncbi:MAG: hypothetical protein P9L94_19830 [Candidatus Hinthialibacter antarcticus]|nr:hypothetical protein [Candidatus Hinthialibacter antarcticus]
MDWLSEPNVLLSITIVLVVEFILGLLVVIGWLNLRRKREKLQQDRYAIINPKEAPALQDLLDQAKQDQSGDPINIVLANGSYVMDESLSVEAPIKLFGKGANETKISAKGNQPAIKIKDAKQCSVSNMKIEGAIQCSNSELLLENCHVVAKEDGICIEADDGSVVTFSGVMRGDGGIAIKARGESKVILKPPYAVSGEDYIVKDPKSKIEILNDDAQSDAPTQP